MAQVEVEETPGGTGKTQYVTRLMKAKCSFGSMSQYLNLPLDHGVWFQSPDTPIMNANDHEPDKHILHFGRCKSSKNPSNSINLEDMILDALSPFGGFLGSKQLKEMLGCEGCKCKPMTITPWKDVDEDYYIDGAPAITVDSTLQCYYGGSITIDTESEVEGGENTGETVESTEKGYHAINKMPDSMAQKLKDFCPSAAEDSAFGSVIAGVMGGTMDYMEGPMSMYAVSPEKSAANYAHNKLQKMPQNAVDSTGNIVNSAVLGNYILGNGTVASQGNGAVAAYNAVNMLSGNANMADIIRFFELLPYIIGNASLGEEAYGLVALLMYMMALNYSVSVSTKKTQSKKMKQSQTKKQGKIKEARFSSTPTKSMKKAKKKEKQVAVMGSIVSDEKGRKSVGKLTAEPVTEESHNLRKNLKESEIMVLIGEKKPEITKGEEE